MLPGLGDPQHLLLLEHPDLEGTGGYGNSLGQRLHSAARQKTLFSPREGMWGLSHPEHPVSLGRGHGGDLPRWIYLRLRFLWV